MDSMETKDQPIEGSPKRSGAWDGRATPCEEVAQSQWDDFLRIVTDEDRVNLVGASHLPQALARDPELKAKFVDYIQTYHALRMPIFTVGRILSCVVLLGLALVVLVYCIVVKTSWIGPVFCLVIASLSGLALADVVKRVKRGQARISW